MDIKLTKALYSPEFIKPLIISFRLLNICNINFFDDNLPTFKKYWIYALIVPCLVLHCISLVYYIIRITSENKNVVDLAYTVPILMITTQAIIKAAFIIKRKGEIKQIIEELGAMWRTTDLTKIQLKKKNAVLSKIYICQRVIYISSMVGSSLYTISPLLECLLRRVILKQDFEWLLPFPCSYPFNPTETCFRYIILYIFQSYCMFMCVFSYIGCEFLMVAICSHLIAEFTILREDFLNLKPIKNSSKRQIGGEETNKIEMNNFIKTHQKLIDLSRRLDESFNKTNFVILFFATVTMCFFAFTAKVATGALFMLNNYTAVVVMMVQLFTLCYFSELLAKESSKTMLPDLPEICTNQPRLLQKGYQYQLVLLLTNSSYI
ncbi:odorant receptor 85c isoform X2 [Plodia interpunctella]|uniref:odorant receptor 85c isoform X2 n=1 Tax=Plodia interpunctella TaxID=58824 RepID=UPI002368DE44|nr:odorant receptor 85c-like isoform X2 [Plodia interpunctella]